MARHLTAMLLIVGLDRHIEDGGWDIFRENLGALELVINRLGDLVKGATNTFFSGFAPFEPIVWAIFIGGDLYRRPLHHFGQTIGDALCQLGQLDRNTKSLRIEAENHLGVRPDDAVNQYNHGINFSFTTAEGDKVTIEVNSGGVFGQFYVDLQYKVDGELSDEEMEKIYLAGISSYEEKDFTKAYELFESLKDSLYKDTSLYLERTQDKIDALGLDQ